MRWNLRMTAAVTPPPCRRCGSADNYFTSRLCARCHRHAPGPKSPV